MRLSVLRVKGRRLRSRTRDIAQFTGIAVVFGFIGVQLIRNPGEFKYVQWIGESGNAAIGWLILVTFAAALIAFGWGALRDAGLVPILYAWRQRDRVRLGPIVRLLCGRMVLVKSGEWVEVRKGAVQDAIPATHGAPRGNPWRLSAPAGRIRLTTTYNPGPDHFRQVVDWLAELGVDARVPDFESR